MLAPPDSFQVPFPAVWLGSILANVPYVYAFRVLGLPFTNLESSYHAICHDIGLPNLAAWSLEPQWTNLGGRCVMPLGVPMSLVQKKWLSQVSTDPEIQTLHGQLEYNISNMPTASSPNILHPTSRQHSPSFQPDDLARNGASLQGVTHSSSPRNINQDDTMTGILATNVSADCSNQSCFSDLDQILNDFDIDTGFIGFPPA